MRRMMIIVLMLACVLICSGVLVFHITMGMGWVDSVYFVIATVCTVGYGDFNLQQASAGIKLFGCFLMLAGAACFGAIFGLLTDSLIRHRLADFLGKRRRHMQDHVVLCGLGNIGIRVLEYLRKVGQEVIVVEKDEQSRFLVAARQLGVPVVFGDVRMATTLQEAQITTAKCLVAVTDEDLANLEAALNARALKEDIRLVLRIFDHNLANKIKPAFNIEQAFSTSALAAPAFAMAAVDQTVTGCFFVGEELMLNMRLAVSPGSQLQGMTTAQLRERVECSVLAHEGSDGARLYHPVQPVTLKPGDALAVAVRPDLATQLQQLASLPIHLQNSPKVK